MTVGECKKSDLSGCLNAKQRRIMVEGTPSAGKIRIAATVKNAPSPTRASAIHIFSK
jgi:hypothetical protein